jgi:hypothetical protein
MVGQAEFALRFVLLLGTVHPFGSLGHRGGAAMHFPNGLLFLKVAQKASLELTEHGQSLAVTIALLVRTVMARLV